MKMTLKEAVQKFVNEMNQYPTEMIRTLMKADFENGNEWTEVTTPAVGDRVYVDLPLTCDEGEIEAIYESDEEGINKYEVKLDNETYVDCEIDDIRVQYDDDLPMWGWMWSFKDSIDNEWLTNRNGIELMSQCGFRVYESEEWGYFFGIDGAGYSFIDEYFTPLYKARGLHWHDEEEIA